MNSKVSKNEHAWNQIFSEDDVLEQIRKHGFYKISATRINRVREARLMTKFDHSVQLPLIFRNNKLSIQPTSRGEYVIGEFDSYCELPKLDVSSVTYSNLNQTLTTLSTTNIFSEPSGLLCAFHSGMIQEVLGEKVLFTTFGRMSTGEFSYLIKDSKNNRQLNVSVENSQCEIDGGFEGETCFGLMEVKIGKKDDFIIRQLYYPYRLWLQKTQKKIIPILLTISNDIFSFYVFRFSDPQIYNSVELQYQYHFCIGESDIELSDIKKIRNRTQHHIEQHSEVFPQADNFPRIVDLLTQMMEAPEPLDKDAVAIMYAFDYRQAGYYLKAAKYLGLVDEENGKFTINKFGISIMASHPKKRKLELAERILSQPIFNEAVRIWIDKQDVPNKQEIIEIMREIRPEVCKGREWAEETISRRATTVLSWARWVLELSNPL